MLGKQVKETCHRTASVLPRAEEGDEWGPGANLVYDAHGNITQLATETLGYDDTNRHLSTTVADGTTVTYQRDAEDRVISMTQTPAGGSATTTHYAFAGAGDTSGFTLTASNTTQEQTIGLPGGATVSIRASSQVWSYPGLSGHDLVTTDAAGTRTGTVALYDPFGDPINPTTGCIGTTSADTAGPANTTTLNVSNGYQGAHGKGLLTLDGLATIEMGARQYVPLLGRFLFVDPVPGGNANDYTYPNDPVNASDLTGRFGWSDVVGIAKQITDNPVFQAIAFGCGFITFGGIAAACGIVVGLAYLVQGDVPDAVIALAGGLVGSAVGIALKAVVKSVIKGAEEATAAAAAVSRAEAIAAKSRLIRGTKVSIQAVGNLVSTAFTTIIATSRAGTPVSVLATIRGGKVAW